MGDYLRFKSALPPRLSEFVILITAREWTQQDQWNAHYPRDEGGRESEIANAIAEGRVRRNGGRGNDLYDFCRELHHNRSVSDATYARAVAKFGEQGSGRCGRHHRLLHAARDGAQHGANASWTVGRTHAAASSALSAEPIRPARVLESRLLTIYR